MAKQQLKDLTALERSSLLVLEHATDYLTVEQLRAATGYKSIQSFRASLRFLEAEKVIVTKPNSKGEPTYAICPERRKA